MLVDPVDTGLNDSVHNNLLKSEFARACPGDYKCAMAVVRKIMKNISRAGSRALPLRGDPKAWRTLSFVVINV